MLVSDDGVPSYLDVAMLIADIEKYDFPVVSGVSTVDSLSDDMFLGVAQNKIVESIDRGVNRKFYECLPNEFRNLGGLIKIWFEGNSFLTIRRDVLEKVHLTHPASNNPNFVIAWAEAGDLANSLYISKAGYSIYADLRVYLQHYRWSHSTPPFNILVGVKEPCLIFEEAKSKVPEVKPAHIIDEIPEKYKDLMDFYYGEARTIKICIVAEFIQENYFQWYTALNKLSNSTCRYGGWFEISKQRGHRIELSTIELTPQMMEIYSENDNYWNPIKEADYVFVYCARQNMDWEWYKAPIIVKKWMNPKSKMICQFDDELWWVWNPDHSWWDKKYNVQINQESPKKFFEETKILDVADLYLSVLNNPPWKQFTNKPVVYMPLPQIGRYTGNIVIPNVATTRGSHILQDKSLHVINEDDVKKPLIKMLATLRHSVRTASINNSLDNVISKLDIPTIYFTNRLYNKPDTVKLSDFPKRSKFLTQMKRDGYMFSLREAYIALDDNDGYVGWSRFAYECALSCVPCVGSTESIKQLFPELYTEHNDYKKQIFLINKLLNDKNFYDLVKYTAFIKATQELSDANLVTKFLKTIVWNLKYIYETEKIINLEQQEEINENVIDKNKKNDFYACYIVYNEEDKIAISLNSIVPYVDKVIVVDGAWEYFDYKEPQSTDKTKEIVERICGDKLIWVDCKKNSNNEYIPWETQVEKRNEYLKRVPIGSWMYILDSDVMVTGNIKDVFDKIKAENSYNGYNISAVKMINFYPVLSENSRETPPKVKHLIWEIEDIQKSGLTDWFKSDSEFPNNLSPVNWIGWYGPVICIYKRLKDMEYKSFHSKIYIGNKLCVTKGSWNIISENLLSVNLKFTNSFERHIASAKHKRFEYTEQRNNYLTEKRKRINYEKLIKEVITKTELKPENKPEELTETKQNIITQPKCNLPQIVNEIPTQKIIIATPFCNEEHSIDKYVESLLAIDYPKELIDIIWIENNSSDNTWELLQKYHKEITIKYNYNSFILRQKTCDLYPSIQKQGLDEYGQTGCGGKIGKGNSYETRKYRPIHQLGIWNDMLLELTTKHDYILYIFADVIVPPNLVKQFITDFKAYPDAGWFGGVMHKRYPRHIRNEEQNPMYYGLASPYLKIENPQKNDPFIILNPAYPYGVRGITEEEIIAKQMKGEFIFEICCSGHVFMIPLNVVSKGFKFILAPLETGLACERFLNNMGLKMYCDSSLYVKHISVDGKIYRHNLTDLTDKQKQIIESLKVEPIVKPEIKKEKEITIDERLQMKFIEYQLYLLKKEQDIPNRPSEGTTMLDNVTRSIITSIDWDIMYGKWKPILDNPELCKELKRKAKNIFYGVKE